MHPQVWSALAADAAPDLLREVHEDYVRAGADVITANTFATSRVLLGAASLGDRVAGLTRRSVEIALAARERVAGGRPVAVAGSLSNMMPMVEGTAHLDPRRMAPLDEAEASYHEQAALLAAAGVDLLLLEMQYRPAYLARSIRAARASGLPVWVGTSARFAAPGDDRVLSFAPEEEIPYADVVDAVLAAGADDVIGVMHTNASVIGPALDILRARHWGPLMAYPDSGHFEMPRWRFVDVIAPATLAETARGWLRQGVQVVGGCCGLGVAHVRALRALLDGPAPAT
jgi:homocysteine S-methyltransferase